VPQLVRDRLTRLTYLQLAVYGYFLYGFGPSVPLLRRELDISRGVSGLHATALAVGTIVTGAVYARLVRRIGRTATMWAGVAGTAAGVIVYSSVPLLPVTLLGALVCGLAGTVVVSASVVILDEHHGPAGPAAISEANATAAGFGLVAPLVIGATVGLGLGWRPGLLVTVLLAVGIWLAYRRPSGPASPAEAGSVEAGSVETGSVEAGSVEAGSVEVGPALAGAGPGPVLTSAPGRLPGRFWLAWMVLVLCIAVEFCFTIWAPDVLAARTGASPGMATAGVTTVVAGMLVGRLVGGRIALRLDTGRLMLGAIALSAVGFAVFWTSTVLWLSMVGLAITGLGIAVQFPLGMARALAASCNRTDQAAGRASWAAAAAVGLAPFTLGAVADQVGTHTAFLLVPLLLAGAAAGVLVRRSERAGPRAAEPLAPPNPPSPVSPAGPGGSQV
jgi:MFS family permease